MTGYERRVQRLHDHVMSHEKKLAVGTTVAELKAMLDEKGIEYNARAKREELLKLLEEASDPDADQDGEDAE